MVREGGVVGIKEKIKNHWRVGRRGRQEEVRVEKMGREDVVG
jgi:hypothetical protein